MAYSAAASLLQTIDILLNHHESSISPQFKDQVMSIHQHTCVLQLFIEEGSSDRVYNWEETIREVTDRAEQIIELLLSDSLLESTVGSSRSEVEKGKYDIPYSSDELERVTEEIESIVSRVMGKRRKTADGEDEELMEIVSRLVGGSSSREMIAICGIGGMGKSTLAGKAYSHPLIAEHFDVCASSIIRECTWAQMIEEFLISMKVEFSRKSSEEELIERFLQILGRRRYLIEVEDVSSLDVLERLVLLPDYGNGSRIIFTTREPRISSIADHIHDMRFLDDDRSWDLLREKIFEGDPCPSQLEYLGKMIARSCGGHHLSIEVVSGILAADQSEAAWEDVSENIKIALEEGGDKVDEILCLGYIYLPHHLRPCFLYLGIFPKECYIRVSRLVKLLVAEGFVKENGSKSLEETGEEYVEDLISRRLVSAHRRKSNIRIRSINVHDLIRGMCLRQAHRDNFHTHFDTPQLEDKEIVKSSRRVSNSSYCDDFLSGVYGSTVRTLVLYMKYGVLDLRCCIGNARLLRILDLLNVGSYYLFAEVFELFHLRYLAFDCSIIPEAISNLQNLRTLIIFHELEGGVFDKLPEGIWGMPQLTYLHVFCFKFPNRKEPTSAPQESLQALSKVVDLVCSRENLKMIPNLKKLNLIYTKKLRDVEENYELHNLIYLRKLEHFKLQTNLSVGEGHKMSCAFPRTLKKLSLRGLQLSWEDMEIVGSLPNLEALKLRNHACIGDTWETSEGGFSRLLVLVIEESNLENWITKSSHFPRLRQLALLRCLSLSNVPYDMAEMPTLKVMQLDETNDSLLRSVALIQFLRPSLGHNPLLLRWWKGKN